MKWVGVTAPAWTIRGTKRTDDLLDKSNPEINFFSVTDGFPVPLESVDKADKIKYPQVTYTWKFPKSKRKNINNASCSPGPGRYSETPKGEYSIKKRKKSSQLEQSLPENFFTKSKRTNFHKNPFDSPPPDSYYPKKPDNILKFSFGYKQDSIFNKDSTIGPGQYSPEKSLNTTQKTFRIGTAERRSTSFTEKVPGPGAYEPKITTEYVQGPVIKSGPEKLVLHSNTYDLPGPGDYSFDNHTLVHTNKKKKITFGGKYQKQVMSWDKNPGAGAYFDDIKFRSSTPGARFSKASRSEEKKMTPSTPGPGQYLKDPDKIEKSHKKKGAKIGTSSRPDPALSDRNTPGPGSYESFIKKYTAPKWTFCKRRNVVNQKAKTPGPGQYTFEELKMYYTQNTGFGTATRKDTVKYKECIPGPGAYESNYDSGNSKAGVKFGLALKHGAGGIYDYDNELGPDQYKLKSTVPQPPPYEKEVYSKLEL